jgi:hypothetical protein
MMDMQKSNMYENYTQEATEEKQKTTPGGCEADTDKKIRKKGSISFNVDQLMDMFEHMFSTYLNLKGVMLEARIAFEMHAKNGEL